MLHIDAHVASKLASLRPAIESLTIRYTQNPGEASQQYSNDRELFHLIQLLSDQKLEHVLCQKIINHQNPTANLTHSTFK